MDQPIWPLSTRKKVLHNAVHFDWTSCQSYAAVTGAASTYCLWKSVNKSVIFQPINRCSLWHWTWNDCVGHFSSFTPPLPFLLQLGSYLNIQDSNLYT